MPQTFGLILLSSWFVVIVLYALRMGRLCQLSQGDQHTSTLAKSAFCVRNGCHSLLAGPECLVNIYKLAVYARTPRLFIFSDQCCIFSTGTGVAVVIDDYSNAHISFPDWEDIALFTTAVAAGMSGVAWHNRSGSQSGMFVVGSPTWHSTTL